VTTPDEALPAWSEPFLGERRASLTHRSPFRIGWGRWLGTGSGKGVRVAIIDSGVEGAHRLVGGSLVRSVRVEMVDGEGSVIDEPEPLDVVGHGTACAGIIHSLAPDAELTSVRVLGANNKTSGLTFAYALDWVIGQGFDVANLSLSSKSEDLYPTFHDLVDRAYFARCMLVCSASNTAGVPSYPAVFSSVVSVASHDIPDPWTFFYNPRPPVEFGAWGVDVPVAWRGGARMMATGNSFAAPHVAGLVALLLEREPALSPFEVKSALAALAAAPSAAAATRLRRRSPRPVRPAAPR
jgi:subtilisin family serine protease